MIVCSPAIPLRVDGIEGLQLLETNKESSYGKRESRSNLSVVDEQIASLRIGRYSNQRLTRKRFSPLKLPALSSIAS